MKNLLIFLFGVGFGVGGTMIWLRKDIKKHLEEMQNKEKPESEEPFVVEDDKKKDAGDDTDNAVQANRITPEMRVKYNEMVVEYKKNEPVTEEDEPDIRGRDETDGGFVEIDADEFMHDHSNEKERLVYFRGDRIMCTESGTIIANPYMLVGGEWENCVGNYADRTAFIRNPKLVTDYEIYVEDGLYSDEYGVEDNYRED